TASAGSAPEVVVWTPGSTISRRGTGVSKWAARALSTSALNSSHRSRWIWLGRAKTAAPSSTATNPPALNMAFALAGDSARPVSPFGSLDALHRGGGRRVHVGPGEAHEGDLERDARVGGLAHLDQGLAEGLERPGGSGRAQPLGVAPHPLAFGVGEVVEVGVH